jgi:hypothetical protein
VGLLEVKEMTLTKLRVSFVFYTTISFPEGFAVAECNSFPSISLMFQNQVISANRAKAVAV